MSGTYVWGFGQLGNLTQARNPAVNPKKLETFLRTNSAGIPYTLLIGIEAIEFPTCWLL